METNVNYTVVGIFVIGLLACIIFAIIWLSAGLFSTESYKIYEINMKESVSGLSVDAPVEYNGVNVGTVSSVQISPAHHSEVQLLIRIKSNTPITEGTRAKLNVRALTGIAFIAMEDKGLDKRPLLRKGKERYPVIETTPSLLLRLDTAVTQLNDSFHQLTTSIHSLLDAQNLKLIKEMLQSSQHIAQLLEVQTIPVMNQAAIDFSNVMRNLSELSLEIKQNPSILVRGNAPNQALGPGER